MKRPIVAAVVVVVVAAAATGGYYYWRSKQTAQAPAPAKDDAALPSGASVNLQAVLKAVNAVRVDVPVDGVLGEFAVKPGDEVYEGQILGVITNETLETHQREAAAEVEKARDRLALLESNLLAARLEESRASADLSRARSDRQRAEKLYLRQQMLNREGATPRKSFEAATAAFNAAKDEEAALDGLARALLAKVEQATKDIDAAKRQLTEREAQLEQAKLDLAAAQLLSPVDGVLVAITKQAGDEVVAGMEGLIEIATDLTLMEAVAEIEPSLGGRIAAGQPAQVHVAEAPSGGLNGQVRLVADGKIHVEFASPTPLIRPGATATISVKVK